MRGLLAIVLLFIIGVALLVSLDKDCDTNGIVTIKGIVCFEDL